MSRPDDKGNCPRPDDWGSVPVDVGASEPVVEPEPGGSLPPEPTKIVVEK